jgi:hypothetical protein
MRFPRHWHKAENDTGRVGATGWSDVSPERARARAEERLRRILDALASGRAEDLDRYTYSADGVILEQEVERLALPGAGEAVISRNCYGALVLNSSNVLFIDVDVPVPAAGLFARLRGRARSHEDALEEELGRIRHWQQEHPEVTLVCYRTRAGFRLVVANRTFEPHAADSEAILEELCNDPLYRTLCRKQACYRARLTPKPWRIGLRAPARTFPFRDATEEQAFRGWNARYDERRAVFAVCGAPIVLGTAPPAPDVQAVLDCHDRWCIPPGDRPLA